MIAVLLLAGGVAAGTPEVEVVHPSPQHARVLLAPRDLPEASLVIRFRTGSASDGNMPGLTRLAQHVLVEASRHTSYARLATMLFESAASLELETGVAHADIILTAPREHFGPLAMLLLEVALDARIDPGAYDAARARTLQDEREHLGGGSLGFHVAQFAADGARWSNEPFGERDAILNLRLRNVNGYIKARMRPANAVVALAGGFDPEPFRRRAQRWRGGDPVMSLVPELALPRRLSVPSPLPSELIAYPLDVSGVEAVAAARVAAAWVEERLNRGLRVRGIGYGVEVRLLVEPWGAFLVVVLPPSEALSAPVRGELDKELAVLGRPSGLGPSALARNLRYAARSLELEARDAQALARLIVLDEGRGHWYGERARQALEAAGAEAVEKLAVHQLSLRTALRVTFTVPVRKRSRYGP